MSWLFGEYLFYRLLCLDSSKNKISKVKNSQNFKTVYQKYRCTTECRENVLYFSIYDFLRGFVLQSYSFYGIESNPSLHTLNN